jgi:hypothetical protein
VRRVALDAASSSDSSLEESESLEMSTGGLFFFADSLRCAAFMSVPSSSLSSELLVESAPCSSATIFFGVTFVAGGLAATTGFDVAFGFGAGFGVILAAPFVFGGCIPICTGGFGRAATSSLESSSRPTYSWLNALFGGRTLVCVFGLDFGCAPGSGTCVFLGLLIAGVARSRMSLETLAELVANFFGGAVFCRLVPRSGR